MARVRAAEDVALARTTEGALMQRAAFGLATHTARMLGERTGGVAGRRVGLLVGAGNNGGDALWAGAYLRRRGVAVTAVLLVPDLESGEYTVTVPALPGYITHGETIEESLAQVEEAIGLYLHGEDEAN